MPFIWEKPGTEIINLAWSKDLYNWDHKVIFDNSKIDNRTQNHTNWEFKRTNPAPLLLENDTVILMYRGSPDNRGPEDLKWCNMDIP